MTFVHRDPLFSFPVNKSLYAPYAPAPGKAGIPLDDTAAEAPAAGD